MTAVEFDTEVTNGQIAIPDAHRTTVKGAVHVIVIPQAPSTGGSIIRDLLRHRLQVNQFQPLTRDEAHVRA